ncbi:MAG: hypothetical protein QOE31_2858 [Solirubrobacteraceae bacterium]|jgi:hypothetical protein|nr:hypothetical protein [Solirubrobacteraceae bacterium]
MLRTARRVAIAAALASTVALAGAASASAAVSVSGLPGSAPIVNKLYVPVAVTVSCDGFEPFFPTGAASVTIRQVVAGKSVAHGTGTVSSLICDSAPHEYTVGVFPDGAGGFPFPGAESPLFRKGDGVISAQVSTYMGSVSAGPQPITLTK